MAAPSPWDLDDGFDARAALDQYVPLVLPALDVDRVRMRALAARARANARKTRGYGWLEEADLAEVAHACDEAARAMVRESRPTVRDGESLGSPLA
jgi:hypothetical protein